MNGNARTLSIVNQAANSILKHHIDNLDIIPAVAVKLLRLTGDINARMKDLSHIIQTEPALSAKIIRNVNSSVFSLPHKVTSIKRAVSILGFSAVRQLTLNQLFYNELIQYKMRREFDNLFFWQHCLFVASLSRAIAVSLKHKDPDSIYAAGLIHDIGKIVLESHGKVSYSDFILAYQTDRDFTLDNERDFFGLNHAELGFVFCQQWNIPEQISAVVYGHHTMPNSASTDTKYSQDTAIISFADYIACMQGVGSVSCGQLPELNPDILNHISFKQLNLEILLEQVDQEMQDTREFYGIKFPNLNQLRVSLIETTMLLADPHQQTIKPKSTTGIVSVESLTIPHRSLEPNEIIPWTLAAIQKDFNFQRLIMLSIEPKKRALVVTYYWSENPVTDDLDKFNVRMDTLPGSVLESLRARQSIIISGAGYQTILTQFKVKEFLITPILSHNRLIALLYADNYISQIPINPQFIEAITPVTRELGIALTNAKRFELEKKRAETDPLTGLMNKRMVIEHLEKLFSLTLKQRNRAVVGFIDIDFFKKFNDTCGHQAGDDVLKIVAQIIQTLTRPNDFIGRYGGEEFVFILHNTDRQGALSYAERVRQEIERKGKILSQRFQGNAITISVGISLYQLTFAHYNEMLEAADHAMYQAKQSGRNCVVIA